MTKIHLFFSKLLTTTERHKHLLSTTSIVSANSTVGPINGKWTDQNNNWTMFLILHSTILFHRINGETKSVKKKTSHTVVPALGEHRRKRPPAVYGHVINVPIHFNVKLPLISGHLPNADSHLLVVITCCNGQDDACIQYEYRWW